MGCTLLIAVKTSWSCWSLTATFRWMPWLSGTVMYFCGCVVCCSDQWLAWNRFGCENIALKQIVALIAKEKMFYLPTVICITNRTEPHGIKLWCTVSCTLSFVYILCFREPGFQKYKLSINYTHFFLGHTWINSFHRYAWNLSFNLIIHIYNDNKFQAKHTLHFGSAMDRQMLPVCLTFVPVEVVLE